MNDLVSLVCLVRKKQVYIRHSASRAKDDCKTKRQVSNDNEDKGGYLK
jgi:hypothetical protein